MPSIAEEVDHDDLQIAEEVSHTQRSWKLQKVAWVILFILVAITCTGLFGDGALSFNAIYKQGVSIQYDRFFRYQAEKSIRISSAKTDIAKVAIAQSLTNYFKVTQVVPEPSRSYIEDNKRVYEFEASKNKIVLFYLTPMEPGNVEGDVVVNGVVFRLKHLIYP